MKSSDAIGRLSGPFMYRLVLFAEACLIIVLFVGMTIMCNNQL